MERRKYFSIERIQNTYKSHLHLRSFLPKIRINEVAMAIIGCTLTLCVVLTALWTTDTIKTTNLVDMCHGHPIRFARTRFAMVHRAGVSYQSGAVVTVGFLTILVEMGCYFVICVHMARHHKSVSDIFSKDEIRRRKKRNVIDLASHVINFFLEILFLLLITVATPETWPRTLDFLSRFLTMCPYGVYPIVTLIFSASLRRDLRVVSDEAMARIFKFLGYLNYLGIFGSLYNKIFVYRR